MPMNGVIVMSNIKFKKSEKTALTGLDVSAIGTSIIDGLVGEVLDVESGKVPEMKNKSGDYDATAIAQCTTRDAIDAHIDIFSKVTAITYDMGSEKEIEHAVVRSFYCDAQINYSIGEFKLYAANDRDTLFSDENEVAHECGREQLVLGYRNNADWLYDVEGSFRYFGMKILNPNPTDDIARLGYIGLYNDEFTYNAEYCNRFAVNMLKGMQPAELTNGVVFDDVSAVSVDGKKAFTFEIENYDCITDAWVIASEGLTIGVDGMGQPTVEALEQGRALYTFSGNTNIKNAPLTVTVEGNGAIDQIGAFSSKREVGVDFDNVICEDFMGIGADVLPMSFMPEAIENGYNEVYWALESERIIKSKPNVVRMWFQIDWFCYEYEQYKTGNYDFDTQKMQSVYRYLDAFKAAGTEIEFNYGWKVPTPLHDWFAMESAQNKRNSPPKELDLYAKSCAAVLVELIKNRGYDNIKYLTFYNEPDYGNFSDNGDFAAGMGVDRRPYWAKMMRLARAELDKCGLDYIKMWACEQSGSNTSQLDWINYMEENCSDVVDCHSFHRYKEQHSTAIDFFTNHMKAAKGTPIMLTECGQNYGPDDFKWVMNENQLFQDLSVCGVSGALIWCLNGIDITDPCSFTMRNPIDYWDCPHYAFGIDNVRENYYRWAMLSHYVPNHSKTVKANVVCGTEDNIRATAFKHGDDYTVVLELNDENSCDRDIKINLGKNIGKKFYKHIYKFPCLRNGNATMPPVADTIFADDVLADTVDGDYQEIVYTTIPPVTQVELCKNEVFLKKGEGYRLTAQIIDGSGKIGYEVTSAIGDSAVFDSVNAIASFGENAKPGDMFAVKAYAVKNPKANSVVIFKYVD